jgi:hypothetical protein
MGAGLFALSDLPIVLDDRAAAAEGPSDTIRTEVALDLIGLSRSGVLNGREEALTSAENGHSGARPITHFVSQKVGRIFFSRFSGEPVLRLAVEDAGT